MEELAASGQSVGPGTPAGGPAAQVDLSVDFAGIHMHIGSQITSTTPFVQAPVPPAAPMLATTSVPFHFQYPPVVEEWAT